MRASAIAGRIGIVLLGVLLLMLSATLALGVAVDYQNRGLVTEGVSIAGRDLSGMTEAEVRSAVEEAVSAPTLRPLKVTGVGRSWELQAGAVVGVDVEGMVAEAYAPKRSATLVQRLNSQLTGQPIPAEVEPRVAVDDEAVAEWVAQTAEQINRKPVDAKRELVGYEFKITPSTNGIRVIQKRAVSQIAKALSAEAALSSTGSRTVSLPTKTLQPAVTESSFKQAIVVSLAQCRVYLYEGDGLVKSYPCAPGRPGFSTPTGDFKVVTKLANAPWINPGSDWAKDMPPSIPPGPNNPMGVRKIGIDYPGVFFHGIPPSEYSSIGTHASHGCMRMMPSDVLDLFGRVKVGTPVYIRD